MQILTQSQPLQLILQLECVLSGYFCLDFLKLSLFLPFFPQLCHYENEGIVIFIPLNIIWTERKNAELTINSSK